MHGDFETASAAETGIAQAPRLPVPFPTWPCATRQLLDEVFYLYRARLKSFLVLSLLPTGFGLLTHVGRHAVEPVVQHQHGMHGVVVQVLLSLPILLGSALALAAYAVQQAATSWFIARLALGDAARPQQALQATMPLAGRFLLIEFWRSLQATWLVLAVLLLLYLLVPLHSSMASGSAAMLMLPATLYGLYRYLRLSLAIPAAVLEHLPARQAMRRSQTLSRGRAWRPFLLYLLLFVLYLLGLAVEVPVLVYLGLGKAPFQHGMATVLAYLMSALISLLITPVASIGLCFLYFDERVRQQGLRLDTLLRGSPTTA